MIEIRGGTAYPGAGEVGSAVGAGAALIHRWCPTARTDWLMTPQPSEKANGRLPSTVRVTFLVALEAGVLARRVMRKTLYFVGVAAFAAACFAGCGGDDGGGGSDAGRTADSGTVVDSGQPVDAGTGDGGEQDAGTDAGTGGDAGADAGVVCAVGDFGDAGMIPLTVSTGTQAVYAYGELNAAVPPDQLAIELFEVGPYENGFTTGPVQITGDETNYATCAACVLIYADRNVNDPDEIGQYYMAKSGTITLTSVEGRLTGTLSNVALDRVTIDANNGWVSTPTGDCEATIASATFDGPFPTDGGTPPDSGTPDSGTPDSGTTDGGSSGPDGGFPEFDGGFPGFDGGVPDVDGGAPDSDGGAEDAG